MGLTGSMEKKGWADIRNVAVVFEKTVRRGKL
jgi:hypothetical protein